MKKLTLILLLILSFVACGPVNQTPAPTSPARPYPEPNAYPGPNDPALSSQPATFSGETLPFTGKIAFHSNRSGVLQLYVMDGATGVTELLQTNADQAYEPIWSPDCQSILYAHEFSEPKDSEIYAVNANGSDPSPFLSESRPLTLEWSPAWSPSGDLIAFQTNPEALLNVCFADNKGNNQGCLEQDNFSNAHLSLSPDGKKLVFISNKDGDWEVYLTNMNDRGQIVQLTDNRSAELHPQFSPDGEFIVFESNQTGNFDIFVMRVDGSDVTQLTFDGEDDKEPVWMGNDKIVFTSFRLSDWELFAINRDGSALTRITYQQGDDKGPAWCAIN